MTRGIDSTLSRLVVIFFSILLSACAVPSAKPTTLMQAAASGDIEAAKAFLDRGARMSERDQVGNTPLLRASITGQSEMVLFLLRNGADAKVKTNSGETALTNVGTWCLSPTAASALIAAIRPDIEEINKSLLNAATGPHDSASCVAFVRFLLDNGAYLDHQSSWGNTALTLASMWGHVDLVKLLLSRGADQSPKNKDGNTALDEAKNDAIRRLLLDSARQRN